MKQTIKIDVEKDYYNNLWQLVYNHPLKWYMKFGYRTLFMGFICLPISLILPNPWILLVLSALIFIYYLFLRKQIFFISNNIFQSVLYGGKLGDGRVLIEDDRWSVVFKRWEMSGDNSEATYVYYTSEDCILMRVRNLHFILLSNNMITGSWEETISLLKKIGMYMDAPITLRYGSISKGKICSSGKEAK